MSADQFTFALDNTKRTVRGGMSNLANSSKTFVFVGAQSNQLRRQFDQSGIASTYHLIGLEHPEAFKHWIAEVGREIEPTAVICDASYSRKDIYTLKYSFTKQEIIPVVLYSEHDAAEYRDKAFAMLSISEDFLYESIGFANIKERIIFLSELKKIKGAKSNSEYQSADNGSAGPSFIKRAFDILVAGLIITLISPILLLIAAAIKLESRGPVFFVAKRAGAGYRVFDFYKFRTMRSDSEQMRDDLKTLNTYYAKDRPEDKSEPFFFKVQNDPRVTRVGRILRKTSLDELPQLFNVLKGDMSLVGNRPLPLDEGATLTIDRWADRFLAPAGMTGLWQIAKNKDNMSVAERIELDLAYVEQSSFSLDMKILLKTLPAMLQRE